MRILVIGAVAAGTSAAAKARRNDEKAEIVIYEKDTFISYSGCGMPYYIGNIVQDPEELTPRDPRFFKDKYNIDVLTGHEVLSIDSGNNSLSVKNLSTGQIFSDTYDKLIIATGARSILPPINGKENANVFQLRNINDMNKIKIYVDINEVKDAVVVGSGFIGIEMCENLMHLGINVTLVEKMPQVMPWLDEDMAVYLDEYLVENKVNVVTGSGVVEINSSSVILDNGKNIKSDLNILATGVKPEVELAANAGVELGVTGAIKVDKHMQTNVQGIFACGDCIETFDLITGKPTYRPLGSTANKTGRICGDSVTGGDLEFRGILGTGIFKFFNLTVAKTGLNEREAIEHGYDYVLCHNIKPDKPSYMGGKEMVIKAIADKKDGRILGAQIVGYEGVDKRIDVFVTAITFGAKAEDLFHLDLAYAPPFSTTKDPVMYTGMILDNALNRGRELISNAELKDLVNSDEKVNIIDSRVSSQYEQEHIPNSLNIPQSKLRDEIGSLDNSLKTVVYCNKGVTGNATQNILLNSGFEKVYNLSGGYKQFKRCKNLEK